MYLNRFTLLIIALIAIFVIGDCQKSANYYENLWYSNVAANRAWQRPTRSREFENHENRRCSDLKEDYDFVIVGAGSAGSVLANRLTEIGKWNVLLLEAGGDETDYSMMPGAFPQMLSSDINWGYLTTPQKSACFGFKNNQCDFARGKVLGGCSSVNAMLHVRGNNNDFKQWPKDWSYEKVLPYFIKSENASSISSDRKYRGNKGPMQINYALPTPPLLNDLIKAHKEIGYDNVEYNAKEQIGFARMQMNTKFGRRFSANQGYLQPILRRANLRIYTRALATKIYFNRSKKAYALKFLHKNRCFYVHPKKEIILSAGSVNTAQLLMLSGVGPRRHLNNLNIPVVANLPVGRNLEDHASVFNINFDLHKPHPINLKEEFAKYANGQGWLTYSDLELSFTKLLPSSDKDVPDVEMLYSFPKNFNVSDLVFKHNNFNNKMSKYVPKDTYLTMHFILLHPKSRGKVFLKSADPLDYPLIDPNYLQHPDDIEYLYLGIMNALRLLQTKTFKAMNAELVDIPIDACDGLNHKDKWYCRIRHMGSGVYHPIATCRMGSDINYSVVNSNLKVHTIGGLRVVDASVVPIHTSGHMNSLIIMMAEKIADSIKLEYGQRI